MREYNTAAKAIEAEGGNPENQPIQFKVDNVVCTAFRPGSGQFGVLMAMTSSHTSNNEQVAGVINFFCSMLDEDSHTYLVNKLLDRKDEFGIAEVQNIMMDLVEEWSARPTSPPSGSSPSPESTGLSSTPTTPALI